MLWAGQAGAQTPEQVDIRTLREQIATQQEQITKLQSALTAQTQLLERLSGAPSPKAAAVPVAPAKADVAQTSPLQFQIGSASITPVGFMDFTAVYRDRTGGSGIGTSFGSIPFSNTVGGQLGEFRFSAQNSRVGFRVDAKAHGANVLGYLESDFLGFCPATPRSRATATA
jgi:hypothetical protein